MGYRWDDNNNVDAIMAKIIFFGDQFYFSE